MHGSAIRAAATSGHHRYAREGRSPRGRGGRPPRIAAAAPIPPIQRAPVATGTPWLASSAPSVAESTGEIASPSVQRAAPPSDWPAMALTPKPGSTPSHR